MRVKINQCKTKILKYDLKDTCQGLKKKKNKEVKFFMVFAMKICKIKSEQSEKDSALDRKVKAKND